MAATPKDSDREAFLALVKGTRPLGGPQRVGLPPEIGAPGAALRRKSAAHTTADPKVIAEAGAGFGPEPEDGAPPAEIRARASGVNSDRMRALGRGDQAPEATLDLHGVRGDAVADRVASFLRNGKQAGRRVLCIITGKGMGSGPEGPVVRNRTVEALSRGAMAADVLAYVTAPPRFGGQGALLVLLRKSRP